MTSFYHAQQLLVDEDSMPPCFFDGYPVLGAFNLRMATPCILRKHYSGGLFLAKNLGFKTPVLVRLLFGRTCKKVTIV